MVLCPFIISPCGIADNNTHNADRLFFSEIDLNIIVFCRMILQPKMGSVIPVNYLIFCIRLILRFTRSIRYLCYTICSRSSILRIYKFIRFFLHMIQYLLYKRYDISSSAFCIQHISQFKERMFLRFFVKFLCRSKIAVYIGTVSVNDCFQRIH